MTTSGTGFGARSGNLAAALIQTLLQGGQEEPLQMTRIDYKKAAQDLRALTPKSAKPEPDLAASLPLTLSGEPVSILDRYLAIAVSDQPEGKQNTTLQAGNKGASLVEKLAELQARIAALPPVRTLPPAGNSPSAPTPSSPTPIPALAPAETVAPSNVEENLIGDKVVLMGLDMDLLKANHAVSAAENASNVLNTTLAGEIPGGHAIAQEVVTVARKNRQQVTRSRNEQTGMLENQAQAYADEKFKLIGTAAQAEVELERAEQDLVAAQQRQQEARNRFEGAIKAEKQAKGVKTEYEIPFGDLSLAYLDAAREYYLTKGDVVAATAIRNRAQSLVNELRKNEAKAAAAMTRSAAVAPAADGTATVAENASQGAAPVVAGTTDAEDKTPLQTAEDAYVEARVKSEQAAKRKNEARVNFNTWDKESSGLGLSLNERGEALAASRRALDEAISVNNQADIFVREQVRPALVKLAHEEAERSWDTTRSVAEQFEQAKLELATRRAEARAVRDKLYRLEETEAARLGLKEDQIIPLDKESPELQAMRRTEAQAQAKVIIANEKLKLAQEKAEAEQAAAQEQLADAVRQNVSAKMDYGRAFLAAYDAIDNKDAVDNLNKSGFPDLGLEATRRQGAIAVEEAVKLRQEKEEAISQSEQVLLAQAEKTIATELAQITTLDAAEAALAASGTAWDAARSNLQSAKEAMDVVANRLEEAEDRNKAPIPMADYPQEYWEKMERLSQAQAEETIAKIRHRETQALRDKLRTNAPAPVEATPEAPKTPLEQAKADVQAKGIQLKELRHGSEHKLLITSKLLDQGASSEEVEAARNAYEQARSVYTQAEHEYNAAGNNWVDLIKQETRQQLADLQLDKVETKLREAQQGIDVANANRDKVYETLQASEQAEYDRHDVRILSEIPVNKLSDDYWNAKSALSVADIEVKAALIKRETTQAVYDELKAKQPAEASQTPVEKAKAEYQAKDFQLDKLHHQRQYIRGQLNQLLNQQETGTPVSEEDLQAARQADEEARLAYQQLENEVRQAENNLDNLIAAETRKQLAGLPLDQVETRLRASSQELSAVRDKIRLASQQLDEARTRELNRHPGVKNLYNIPTQELSPDYWDARSLSSTADSEIGMAWMRQNAIRAVYKELKEAAAPPLSPEGFQAAEEAELQSKLAFSLAAQRTEYADRRLSLLEKKLNALEAEREIPSASLLQQIEAAKLEGREAGRKSAEALFTSEAPHEEWERQLKAWEERLPNDIEALKAEKARFEDDFGNRMIFSAAAERDQRIQEAIKEESEALASKLNRPEILERPAYGGPTEAEKLLNELPLDDRPELLYAMESTAEAVAKADLINAKYKLVASRLSALERQAKAEKATRLETAQADLQKADYALSDSKSLYESEYSRFRQTDVDLTREKLQVLESRHFLLKGNYDKEIGYIGQEQSRLSENTTAAPSEKFVELQTWLEKELAAHAGNAEINNGLQNISALQQQRDRFNGFVQQAKEKLDKAHEALAEAKDAVVANGGTLPEPPLVKAEAAPFRNAPPQQAQPVRTKEDHIKALDGQLNALNQEKQELEQNFIRFRETGNETKAREAYNKLREFNERQLSLTNARRKENGADPLDRIFTMPSFEDMYNFPSMMLAFQVPAENETPQQQWDRTRKDVESAIQNAKKWSQILEAQYGLEGQRTGTGTVWADGYTSLPYREAKENYKEAQALLQRAKVAEEQAKEQFEASRKAAGPATRGVTKNRGPLEKTVLPAPRPAVVPQAGTGAPASRQASGAASARSIRKSTVIDPNTQRLLKRNETIWGIAGDLIKKPEYKNVNIYVMCVALLRLNKLDWESAKDLRANESIVNISQDQLQAELKKGIKGFPKPEPIKRRKKSA